MMSTQMQQQGHMQQRTANPGGSLAWRHLPPAARRQRPRSAVRASAVQPDKKPAVPGMPVNIEVFRTKAGAVQPETKPAVPQAPVRIDVFETKDAPQPQPIPPAAEGSWPWLDALLSGELDINTSEPMSFDGEERTEYDPLRDGPLRYLGYANEAGEAFAAWLFPGGVALSYAIAIGYVCFDTVDKYWKTLEDARAKLTVRPMPPSVDLDRLISTIGLERGLDTLTWQLIASVAAPGYTIHTLVAIVSGLLQWAEQAPEVLGALHQAADALGLSSDAFLEAFNKSVPTACGLLAIPLIVHPIDTAVHALLNHSLRPLLRRHICNATGGAEAGLAICKDCQL